MTNEKTVLHYCGRPINELPREELEEAFAELFNDYTNLNKEVSRRRKEAFAGRTNGRRSESDAGGPAMSERPGLNELMRSMPPQWRYRWCESALCGCLGCANGSGRLTFYGYTHEEHNEWIKNNPKKAQP